MRYLALLVFLIPAAFVGCSDRPQAIACYSGGGLIWKGHAKDSAYVDDNACVSFTDGSSGLEMTICADCYLEETSNGQD